MHSLKLKQKLPLLPEYGELEHIRLKRKQDLQMPVLSEDADMYEPDLKLKRKMPKTYEDEPDPLVTISFKVNVQERETLQKMARKMDLNISQTIRKMLFNSASEKVYSGLSTNDKIHKLAIAAKTSSSPCTAS